MGRGELLDGLLPLDEQVLEGGDALLEPVHSDLAAAARGQRRRQLRHVRVQLVPTHAQGLSFGLNNNQSVVNSQVIINTFALSLNYILHLGVCQPLSDLVVLLQRHVEPLALLLAVLGLEVRERELLSLLPQPLGLGQQLTNEKRVL